MKTVVYPTSPGIGDLIWHLPFIRAIAAESAGGRVTVVARSSTLAREWLSPDPAVDEVLYHHRRQRRGENRVLEGDAAPPDRHSFVQDLRLREFERAFLFSARVKPAVALWRAGIPRRAGYGHSALQRIWLNRPPFIKPYPGPLAPRLYFDAAAFAAAHGLLEGPPPPPRLYVPPDVLDRCRGSLDDLGEGGVVGLAIGASADWKNWGAARFAALAQRLISRGFGVLALGGPAEEALAESIRLRVSGVAAHGLRCMISRSVLESAAMLGQCAFLVGNDTGMLNVAVASGTRALGLFGATTPLSHDPELEAVRGEGMAAIAVEEVVARLDALGWALPGGSPGGGPGDRPA